MYNSRYFIPKNSEVSNKVYEKDYNENTMSDYVSKYTYNIDDGNYNPVESMFGGRKSEGKDKK